MKPADPWRFKGMVGTAGCGVTGGGGADTLGGGCVLRRAEPGAGEGPALLPGAPPPCAAALACCSIRIFLLFSMSIYHLRTSIRRTMRWMPAAAFWRITRSHLTYLRALCPLTTCARRQQEKRQGRGRAQHLCSVKVKRSTPRHSRPSSGRHVGSNASICPTPPPPLHQRMAGSGIEYLNFAKIMKNDTCGGKMKKMSAVQGGERDPLLPSGAAEPASQEASTSPPRACR